MNRIWKEKEKKTLWAYVVSSNVVQIGDTVFDLASRKKFQADRKGLKGELRTKVSGKSFSEAQKAVDYFYT